MGRRKKNPAWQLSKLLLLMFIFSIQGCWTLNEEGLALWKLQARVEIDQHGMLDSWNPNDSDPCNWIGVHCVDGWVHVLNMSGQSVKGTLAPEIGALAHLKSLVLNKNNFYGEIPREFGNLKEIELMDLRENNLSGTIPEELGTLYSLRKLLLCNNKFRGSIPKEFEQLRFLSELQFDENLTLDWQFSSGCLNRKFGHCVWQRRSKQLHGTDSLIHPIKGTITRRLDTLPFSRLWKVTGDVHANNECINAECLIVPKMVQNKHASSNFARRKLLEQSSNLMAAPVDLGSLPSRIPSMLITRSSGSFPAVPGGKSGKANAPTTPPSSDPPPAGRSSGDTGPSSSSKILWKFAFIIPGIVIIIVILTVMIILCRKQGARTIGPWKTGLSGQLQKAFVTGVPKLRRSELETACEDFSNIVSTYEGCIVFKGTLSSGVEIAVTATSVASAKDWSVTAEKAYRRKVKTLSRVNHENFVNLIGYCEERQPFARMMVFEYAPNGALYEHLHGIKDAEHLDWTTRMRITMGTAYCLRYMHHDLSPPVPHSNLNSSVIFLTDDFAAKVAETSFCVEKNHGEEGSKLSEPTSGNDLKSNVYNFGMILLEVVSGRYVYSEEQGSLVDWASEYLNDDGKSVIEMVDPSLNSFEEAELKVICEVARQCLRPDPTGRPTMDEVVSNLRQVIRIAPEQATPKLSPLWWAELEILSVEAN
ncbi:hypothetical protein MLD38_039930 [Melastoma candidum]|uniref:Uncharacterized protein n=1 Tax=Melastoma candidum TaxID=119954 RepID=A0ACB9L589_9MYRT|nr:hypothetical protein MLD38_039930 [Melastoma candidum]